VSPLAKLVCAVLACAAVLFASQAIPQDRLRVVVQLSASFSLLVIVLWAIFSGARGHERI